MALSGTGPDALPPDSHVHSQWSWDALAGSMEGTCQRAVEIGLPAVAFTEHADFTPWTLSPGDRIPDEWHQLVSDGVLTAPALDLDGYRDCLRRCFAVGRDPTAPGGGNRYRPDPRHRS